MQYRHDNEHDFDEEGFCEDTLEEMLDEEALEEELEDISEDREALRSAVNTMLHRGMITAHQAELMRAEIDDLSGKQCAILALFTEARV